MRFFDHVKIGERIGWATVNGYRAGVVRDITPEGVVVAVDGGGDMVLSTVESYRNFINKTHINQSGEKDVGAGGSPAKASC